MGTFRTTTAPSGLSKLQRKLNAAVLAADEVLTEIHRLECEQRIKTKHQWTIKDIESRYHKHRADLEQTLAMLGGATFVHPDDAKRPTPKPRTAPPTSKPAKKGDDSLFG